MFLGLSYNTILLGVVILVLFSITLKLLKASAKVIMFGCIAYLVVTYIFSTNML